MNLLYNYYGDCMSKSELKNCPNCNERIGIHDVECPYCKYIDDPKYKKHNNKLIKNKIKSKRKKKNDIYKVILIIPIIAYLILLLFKIDYSIILFILMLLNILCMFIKKTASGSRLPPIIPYSNRHTIPLRFSTAYGMRTEPYGTPAQNPRSPPPGF